MNKPLRILNVEDSERDSVLLQRHLRRAEYDLTWGRVETGSALRAAIAEKDWDAILCDYSMPRFSAVAALKVLRETGRDIPFIIISGTVGEEIAVEALLTGANDYIPKGNLTRLIPAIERELLQADNRREKRQADLERRRSDDRYRALFDYAPDGIIISGPDSYYLDANASMCGMLGYEHSELIGMHASDIVVRSEVRELDSEFALVATSSEYNREWHFRRKNGSEFPAEVIATIMPDGNLLAMIRDISERLEAEKALRKSEDVYRTLFECAPDGILIADPDGRYIDANTSICSMLGYPRSELIGLDANNIVAPSEIAHIPRALNEINNGEDYSREWQFNTRNGSLLPVEVIGTRLPDGNILAMVRDISERKENEGRLRQIQINLAKAQEIAHVGSWELDLPLGEDRDGSSLRWSDEVFRIFGHRPGAIEVTNENFFLAAHPDDRENIHAGIDRALHGGEPYNLDHRIILPDGSERIVHEQSELVFDEVSGEPIRMVGTVQDITERNRAEEDIRRRQTELRVLFDVMPAMIWFKDTENNILRVNKQVAEATGLTVEEIEGKPSAEIYPDDAARFYADDLEVLRSGKPKLGYVEMLSSTDDENVWVQTDKVPYFDEDGSPIGIVVIAQDVTERKNAEQALRESDEKFHQLADNITDAFWIRSPDLNQIHYISPAFESIWGRPLESVYSKPQQWLDFILPDDRAFVKAAYEELMGPAQTIDIDYRILRPNGERRWLRTRGFQVRDADGHLIRLAGIVSDITESKTVTEALAESEERYRELVENAIDVIYTLDLEGNYTSMNRAGEIVTGYTVEESLQRNITDSMVPEHREIARQMLLSQAHGENLSAFELEIVAKDGRRVALEIKTRPIRKNGVAVGVQGIARDITERKLADARINRLVNSNAQAVFFWNTEGQITGGNDAFVTLTGQSQEDMQGGLVSWISLTPPEFAYIDQEALDQLLATGTCATYEKEWIHKDGSRIPILMGAAMLEGNTREGVCFVLDIRERKNTEAALKESETRYRSLFDTANDAIIVVKDGVFIDCNPRTQLLFGCSKEWILGRAPADVSPPTQADGILSTDKAILYTTAAMQGLPQFFEWQHMRKDGTIFDAEVSLNRVDFHDETHIQAIVRDITDRKKAESLLIEGREQLALAAESVNLGIWDWNIVGDEMDWDARMLELYGIEADDFSGGAYGAWLTGLHPDDRAMAEANIKAALDGERPFNNEFRVIWPNGNVRNIEARAVVKRDGTGTPLRMIGVNWDITARKELEDQYRQAQKMEAVGVLAGGIAHDFNNLLTAINGFSDLTLRRMEADSPFRRNVQEIKNAGERAAELTGQLLAFSRKQVLKPSVINLNSVISNIEMMLRRIIRESVELQVILDPKLGNVLADPGQIEQVIMNLTINARDAMMDGGHLTIETTNVFLGEEYSNQHLMVKPGKYVRITVSDTGVGMDATTQSHIFEPFFSTKEVGKGTGLGLATVYGIVQQSGGSVMVYSEVGFGTTFKVYLPCVDRDVDKPIWPNEPSVVWAGTETILLVEDENAVRKFVLEVLESSGYTVLEAPNGPAALEICRSYQFPIHLLISDIIMPKMGGAELKKRVVELLPEVSILFISGYTSDSIAARGIDDPDIAFLEKPFTPDGLIRKVREVLGAS
jgi:two-component system cell cycle sensor histidine kinase/response regulator CckA